MEHNSSLTKTVDILNKFCDIFTEQECSIKSIPESEHQKEIKKLFEERVHTYIPSMWPLKPPSLSPLTCARYGWKCVSRDTLSCVTCGELLIIRLDKPYIAPKSYESSVLNFEECLLQNHKKLCPWKFNPINESIFALSWSNFDEAFFWVECRLFLLLSIEKEIPGDIACAAISKGSMHTILELFSKNKELSTFDRAVLEKCLLLALSGWSSQKCLSESKSTSLLNLSGKVNVRRSTLQCHVCLRTIGLWNYYPRAKLAAIHNKSQVDECVMLGSGDIRTMIVSETRYVNDISPSHVPDSDSSIDVCVTPTSCTVSNWSTVNNVGDETPHSDLVLVESGVEESRMEASSNSSSASVTNTCKDVSNSEVRENHESAPEVDSSITTSDVSQFVLDVESGMDDSHRPTFVSDFSKSYASSYSNSSPASITDICNDIACSADARSSLSSVVNWSMINHAGDTTSKELADLSQLQSEAEEVDAASAQLSSNGEVHCEMVQGSEGTSLVDLRQQDDVSSTSGQTKGLHAIVEQLINRSAYSISSAFSHNLEEREVADATEQSGSRKSSVTASDNDVSMSVNDASESSVQHGHHTSIADSQTSSATSSSNESSPDDKVEGSDVALSNQLCQERLLADVVMPTKENSVAIVEPFIIDDSMPAASSEGGEVLPSHSSTPLCITNSKCSKNLLRRHLNSDDACSSPLASSALTLQADKLHWNWCPWSASCDNSVTRKLLRCLLCSEESSVLNTLQAAANTSPMEEFDEPRSKRRSLEQNFLHVSRIMRQLP